MAGTTPTASGRIFISYRREETAYPAGWLYARLVEHFGREQVFKDVDSIELGDEFPRVIAEAVGSCDVLLALIGGQWLTVADPHGRRRLDNRGDFVRLEIEAALQRGVRVIPILVDGATMPDAAELPPSLAGIVHRHALELSPSRFEFDSNRLLRVLDRTLDEKPRPMEAASRRPPARRWVPMGIATAILVAGVGAMAAFSALGDTPPPTPTTSASPGTTGPANPTTTTRGPQTTRTTLIPADLFRGFILRRPSIEYRAKPRQSAEVLGYVPYNTPVYIVCTATGDAVTGPGRAGSAPITTRVWDKVRTERGGDDLGFVPDAWVKTGTTEPVARAC
jgi:hypothetical protein